MEKLGVLVVGPGWVAGQHIRAYLKNPWTELRALAGVLPEDRDRARKYMTELNFSCEYYDDYEAALKRADIDIVAVCTINHLHFPQGLAALQAGKHTFLEKPMCFTPAEGRQLVDAAATRGLTTYVGHVVRHYPAVAGLHSMIRRGAIGKVYYCESGYWHEIKGAWKTRIETGGNSLLMAGCHSVDMVRWMVGEDDEVVEVTARSVAPKRRLDFEYDPTLIATLRFASGALGNVSVCLESSMPYVFHLQVNGTSGSVRNNGIYSHWFPGQRDFMRIPATYPDDWEVSHHPFPEEVADFVDCIRLGREPELSFRRAQATYQVMTAAIQSARDGIPVDPRTL